MSREITEAEASDRVMRYIATISKYWADLPDKTPLERCNGLAFSLLNIFDGTTVALPKLGLVVRPHPDDKAFHEEEGTDYYVDGMELEGVSHELWSKYEISK
jgi:hypothetical protein